MNDSLIGICVNHDDRDGLWVAADTYLCTECAAKEIVVLGAVGDTVAREHPERAEADPMAPMRRVIGQLVHAALDQLWYSSPDALPDDPTPEQRDDHYGCCPQCCAPCAGLLDLAKAGWLDDWVLFWPDTLPQTSWWDEERQQVDRDWLRRAWGQTDKLGCVHE